MVCARYSRLMGEDEARTLSELRTHRREAMYGPTPPVARWRTWPRSNRAVSSRSLNARSREDARCRQTSPAAIPPALGYALASSMSSPRKNAAAGDRADRRHGPPPRQNRHGESRLQFRPAGLAQRTTCASVTSNPDADAAVTKNPKAHCSRGCKTTASPPLSGPAASQNPVI
jgi:hypothetical protein